MRRHSLPQSPPTLTLPVALLFLGIGVAVVLLRPEGAPPQAPDTPSREAPPTASEPRSPFAHFLDDGEIREEARRRVEAHYGPVGLNAIREQMGPNALQGMISSEKEAVRAERLLFLRIVDVAGEHIARGEADDILKRAMAAVWETYRPAVGVRAQLGTPAVEAAAYPPNDVLARDLAAALSGLRAIRETR